MDDRRRPVAERDHLALPARLEPRRHHERVGARIDTARHRAIEPFDERDLSRIGGRQCAERVGEIGMATPLDDEPVAARQHRRRCLEHEIEPLLGIQPSDESEHRAGIVGIEPVPRQQVGATRRLAGPVGARERRGRVGICRRIPDRGVQAIQDADEAVAFRAFECQPQADVA